MRKILLLAAALLGLTTPAFAQSVPNPGAFTGTEFLRCTTNAGSACNILMNHVRNTVGYLPVPTGGTVNTTPTWYNELVIATGAITTWNVTFPNPAPDGMVFTVANSTAAAFTTNTTVTTTAGIQSQTLAVAYAGQTLAANGGRASWIYNMTNTTNGTGTWYRSE